MKSTLPLIALLLCVTSAGSLAQQPAEAETAFRQGVAAYNAADWTTAMNKLRPLAEQGHAGAQYGVAQLYDKGRGVAKDDAAAAGWYRKAAEQGDANACNMLGLLYQTGRGVTRDQAMAAQWYRKAADQGHPKAQYNLGSLYEAGQGVTKDYATAAQWYRKAADQGNSYAQNSLGLLYGKGLGVPRDFGQSAQWHRKSAEQGDPNAQFNLGMLYAAGQGVPQNYAAASEWFGKAAAQGVSDANRKLAEISTARAAEQSRASNDQVQQVLADLSAGKISTMARDHHSYNRLTTAAGTVIRSNGAGLRSSDIFKLSSALKSVYGGDKTEIDRLTAGLDNIWQPMANGENFQSRRDAEINAAIQRDSNRPLPFSGIGTSGAPSLSALEKDNEARKHGSKPYEIIEKKPD